MAQKTGEPRPYIKLKAFWGNDAAHSTIKVSRRRWKAIQDGAKYVKSAWGWYEGSRFSVLWSFSDGKYWIDGDDAGQCVVGDSVSSLIEQSSIPDA